MIASKNPFLAQLMQRLRAPRPLLTLDQPFFNRVESVPNGTYVEVWFLTRGCSWDRRGGCTMCNYGRGADRTVEQIVDSVAAGLGAIDVDVDELLVSPSGGMLDEWEVPSEARRGIYDLVEDFPATTFLIETRPETVTPENVAELRERVPGKQLGVEFGLESSSSWIEQYCVNRGHNPEQFVRAAATVRQQGVRVYGNVSLGTVFLSPLEAIDDAVRTVRWGFESGASSMVIFPLHIKPFTLLDELGRRGQYRPPSLWSLVEALRRLSDLAPRVEIAWYRSYYDTEAKIRRSPTTCPRCRDEVLRGLDDYRATQDPEVVEELSNIACSCHQEWQRSLEQPPQLLLPERVITSYELLARDFGLDQWWSTHGNTLREELFENWEQAGAEHS